MAKMANGSQADTGLPQDHDYLSALKEACGDEEIEEMEDERDQAL